MTHRATYTETRYPGSSHAASVKWECSCGKSGIVEDGRRAAHPAARSAHRRHVTAALAHA